MNERRYYSEEAKSRAQREMALLMLLAISVGAGVGSIIALLLAPKKGEAIRDDVGHIMEKQVKRLEHQLGELRSKLEDRISDLT